MNRPDITELVDWALKPIPFSHSEDLSTRDLLKHPPFYIFNQRLNVECHVTSREGCHVTKSTYLLFTGTVEELCGLCVCVCVCVCVC